MPEEINPLTGLPLNDVSVSNPVTNPENINPLTNQVIEESGNTPVGISGSTLTPKIHEQIRLLGNDASYTKTNPEGDLANAQSVSEEVSRGLAGFNRNMAAGFIDALGVDFDPSIGMNVIGGVDEHYDKEASNLFTRMAEKLRDSEGSEIYQKQPNSFNPADTAWWSEMFQQSGTSVGIMLEALAETAAVSYVTGGLGTLSALGTNTAKVISLLPKLTKAQKLKKNALIWAGFRRYSESLIEGKDNGLQTYNEYLRQGFTDKEASKAASETAQKTFMGNMPLLALDLITAGAMTNYNPISGNSTSKLKNIFNITKNKGINKSLQIGTGALSEGSEEFWQELVNEEAKYQVDVSNGLIKENNNRFNDYAKSGKAWNAFASGIFGSAVLGGISKGLEKISNRDKINSVNKHHSDFINNISGLGIEIKKEIDALDKVGEVGKANVLRRKLGNTKALLALHLDNLNDSSSATESYEEYLNDVLNAAENNNEEELESLGIKDKNFIQENFPKYIKDLNAIKDIYNKEKNNNDPDFVPLITDTEFAVSVLSERQEEIKNSISNPKEFAGKDYERLTSIGKEKFDLITEKESIQKSIETVSESFRNSTGNSKELYNTIGERYRLILSQVDSKIKSIDYGDINKLDIEKDNSIINSLSLDQTTKLKTELKSIETAQEILRDKLSSLKNKEVQKKARASKVNETINKSTSSSELNNIKEELADKEELSEIVEENLNDKIEQAKVKELNNNGIEPNFAEPDLKRERKVISQSFDEVVFGDPDKKALVIQDEDLFEPLLLKDLSEDQKNKLDSSLKDYYESLKIDLGKAPTFEEFVRDYIEHSSKDNADKLFNAFAEGWKNNSYSNTEFDKVYNQIFRDRNELGRILTDSANSTVNPEELNKEADKQISDSIKNTSAIVGVDQNNRPIFEDLNKFKASDSKLRAGYLSIKYSSNIITNESGEKKVITQDSSELLNESPDINSIKLLNPERFNKGEKLNVRIPDNYKDIRIQTWEDASTKGDIISFGSWMSLNNVEEDSDDFISKVPMIAYDSENEPVFFIHDLEWYNYKNVGLADNPEKQDQVIFEARENLKAFRNNIKNSTSISIEITEKRPGTIKKIPKGQPAITLNEANPNSILGIVDSTGDLYVNGTGEIFENDNRKLINDKSFNSGHIYDIRKVSKDSYVALPILRPTISEDVSNTLKQAIRAYIFQYDIKSQSVDNGKINNINKKVTNLTGYDLFNKRDFEEFLNLFVYTIQRPFNTNQEIVDYVRLREDLSDGSPFVVMQKGSLVFGLKNRKIANKDFLFLNPNLANGKDSEKMISTMMSFMGQLDNIIPTLTQNVSKKGLAKNKKIISIKDTGEVLPIGDYKQHLRNTLKTNVRSFNISNSDKPVYATIVQPVINFELTGKSTKSQDTVENSNIEPTSIEDNIIINSDQILKDSVKALLEMGVSENDPSIIALKQQMSGNQEGVFEPVVITEEQAFRLRSNSPLSIIQEFNLVDFVFNEISKKIDFNYGSSVSTKEVLGQIKSSYFDIITPKKENNEKVLKNLKALSNTNPTLNANLNDSIKKFEEEIKVFDIIKDNWNLVEKKALAKVNKYTGITQTSLENGEVDDNVYSEKNYSKSSLEENGKETASYRLKRFFSGIQDVKPNGEVKNGFLGVPVYVGFDKVYETIGQILSSPYEMESDFNSMITRLQDNIKNQKWLPQVIDKLNSAPEQIKNEFVYNFTRHSLSMKFMMFSKNRDGSYSTKVYDTNGNEITKVIRRQWDSNLKNSNLVFVQDGQHKINKVKAKSLLDQFNIWQREVQTKTASKKDTRPIEITNKELRGWLDEFGIILSEESFNEIRNRKIEYLTQDGKKTIEFNQMFQKTNKTPGIFGLLANYLEDIIKKDDTSFDDKPENHPFNDANNVLKTLSRIESKYSLYATTNSFRDGGKSIYGFTPTKHATDVVNDLKFNKNFRDQLFSKSFNSKSYILQILENNEVFRDKFYVDHIGITALKELGKKAFGDNSVTSLSDVDHEYLKVGLFQDTEQGGINYSLGENDFIGTRMSRMFFPTMSDKSQMLSLYTAVLDIENKHFNIADSNVDIKDETLDVISSQLIDPELDRIYNFLKEVKSTNIKGYDFAAQMFLMIPELNNLVDQDTGTRVLSLMINDPIKYNKNWFNTKIKPKAKDILRLQLQDKVSSKLDSWKDSSLLNEDNSVKFLNKKYFDKFNGNPEVKAKLAAYDYVINSQLTNANIIMLFAGDMALYSQNKIKNYFDNGKPYLPKSLNEKLLKDSLNKEFITQQQYEQLVEEDKNKTYSKVIKDIIAVNLGKRLALMLAPGNKLANSKNLYYEQIFLEDTLDISSNVETLVKLFYNNDEALKAKILVKEYNKSNREDKKVIAKKLAKAYPLISDYFEVEGTDAQEYTTIKEHIEVLWGQGRLSDDNYKTINDKIKNKEDLNLQELGLILQPIKPVHTGFLNEDRYDVMRMMYIKSSSFPLIPQITKGTELDGLRLLMEDYESKKGKSVRASYQSANKVGSINKVVSPFDSNGNFNTNLSLKDIEMSSLVLSRDNFRIQQDVPVKKKDVISLGTQTLKLLFGDGITDLNGFKYNNKEYSGKDLKEEFNKTYNDYIEVKQKQLYNQLGIDSEGQPLDIQFTMSKLQELLKSEAEDRGYPQQDIDSLELVPRLDSKGNIKSIEFTVPLWMSPNSNRYESLLNAIVTNRLANIKLPGKSYVVGSEAGFKIKDNFEGIDKNKIVFTSKFDGSLKAYTKDNLTQVMIPSNFKDNQGNLIRLVKKDGKPNLKYVNVDSNGKWTLKEEMVDSSLLNFSSFRIPTSGHVSMSQVEVVGFLPNEAGDLMIVPKNLTKQKGLDFDVDKENIYKLWTRVNSEGKVEELNESHKNDFVGYLEEKLAKEESYEDLADGLFSAIFQDNPNYIKGLYTDNTLSIQDKIKKLSFEFDQKVLENKIVKIHSSILSNNSEKVQKKINKVLSIDFAKSQADLIQSLNEKNLDNTYFTALDDVYQKEKMYLGASGKLGIGVYSNYVVFNSMIQQLEEDISIKTKDEDGNTVPLNITIGNLVSNGKLGRIESLGKSPRDISEVFAERQNTATDNEKEQIMGKVNVNELTINVDSLLSALGFDKDIIEEGKEVSIPYLLLSQPIIKDYVNKIRKTQSSINEFDANAKNKVIEELRDLYKTDVEIDSSINSLLTGQELYNNINDPKNSIQIGVLNLFLELDSYAKTIGQLQNRLNINNAGLGKSYFDTLEKYYGTQNLQKSTEFNSSGLIISNATKLIGDYLKIKEDLTERNIQDLINKGYYRFSDYLIKPQTPVGAMLVHTVKVGHDLWSDFFPYDEVNIRSEIDYILSQITKEDTNSTKIVELQQNIFKDMKKYFVTSDKLDLFTGNPQIERERLFIDTGTKQSLASYLLDNKENLKSNKLLSRFEYSLNKNGLPSIIKFDGSKSENFDEDYLYFSLVELIENNIPLNKFNGQDYSTRQLAKDLIIYSYLEGGIQEAIQFVKYIPVSYLSDSSFAANLREWSSRPGIFAKILGDKFSKQYLQHNPEKLFKITENKVFQKEYSKSNELYNLESFQINDDELTQPELLQLQDSDYISMYNPSIKKGLKKFQVYKKDGNTWRRQNTLGVFGMSEYSIKDPNVKSLVNSSHNSVEDISKKKAKDLEVQDTFNIGSNNLSEIIANIKNHNFEKFSFIKDVASSIENYIPSDINIEIGDIINSSGQKVRARGHYLNKKITLDKEYFKEGDQDSIARTIVKEVVHALTFDYMKEYVDSQGNYKTDTPPKEIMNLSLLFNEVKRNLSSELEIYSGKPKNAREKNVVYGGTNIYEFVEVVMTEPDFQKEMQKVMYKSTDKSLLDKFAEIIDSILKKVLGENYGKNNITYQAIKNTLSIIEKQAVSKDIVKSPLKEMQDADINSEANINDESIDFSKLSTGEQTLLEPVIYSNFDNFLKTLPKKDC